MTSRDRDRLVLLNLVPYVGSVRVRRLLVTFGSVEALWVASAEAIANVEGVGPVWAERIVAMRRDERALQRELALIERAGASVAVLDDADYPAPLKQITDPPLVLYRKGSWKPSDASAVAIVGSRHASPYGRQMAERLGYELAMRGLTVVSGLARGIDAAAHRGALRAGGRTIGVLGGGLDRLYPPEHDELAEQIMAQGAVLSEYPMTMDPLPRHFPQRNRVISGLSWGVVVVEAAARSGALITADCALEQGREVFAVPGHADSATSQGTHHLLKQGARLAASVDDIVEELGIQQTVRRECGHAQPAIPRPASDVSRGGQHPQPAMPEISETEHAVWAQLDLREPSDVETVALHSGLPAGACAATLLGLELKRLVTQLPGQRYLRR